MTALSQLLLLIKVYHLTTEIIVLVNRVFIILWVVMMAVGSFGLCDFELYVESLSTDRKENTYT